MIKYTGNTLIGLSALILAGHATAWGGCEYSRQIDETLNLSSSDVLEVIAAAGDLEIVGREGSDSVRVQATVCASKAEWAETAGVDLSGGETALVAVVIPEQGGFGWGNDRYVYVDLALDVPRDMLLDIKDSSGDMELSDVGRVILKDSSGDIEVDGALSVELQDSSGDIDLYDVSGDVTVVSDSSGDIRGRDVGGSVLVARDSSGDIRFRNVTGDFLVERDSSGDIEASTVGGDFAVLRDGSGEVRHSGVSGSVQVPKDG